MKLAILFLSTALLVSCGGGDSKKAAEPKIVKTTVNLPTMRCTMCAKHITKAVKGVDGVNEVAVSVDDKNAVISYVEGKTDMPRIEAAIAAVGYDANGTKRNNEAYEKLDECCK